MELHQLNNIPNEDAVIEALTLTYKIDSYGSKAYFNKDGQFHRIHGPAVVTKDGYEAWYKNGLYHREDGPAISWPNGNEEYHVNGMCISKSMFQVFKLFQKYFKINILWILVKLD